MYVVLRRDLYVTKKTPANYIKFAGVFSLLYGMEISLDLCESLVEVSDDVVDVLYTDREAHGRRSDVLLLQFLWGHLRVSGCVRVDDE